MLIKLENIKKDYISGNLKTPALRGIDLEIKKGEFIAIMGASGSGKSTLMHILGFLDRPTSGKYFFEGQDTSGFTDDQLAYLRNQKLGFVFQNFNLLPKISVLDNVLLPVLYNKEADVNFYKEKAKKLLEKVGIGHRASYHPNEISGGEQQRVAIVRALMNDPSLVLADEPTGNLDSKAGEIVMDIFNQIHKEGKTIIVVTHEDDIASYAQRVIEIKDGKIIKQ